MNAIIRRWAPVALLLVLALSFWKLRIIDTGVRPRPSFNSGDLYAQHYPMTLYGFEALRRGDLPLWNPFQLCGEPFLAMPYVGLFYPLNAPYLLLGMAEAIEVETIVHMLIGMVGMWALMRSFGTGHLAAVTAAVTFAWSGWLIYNVNQPSLFAGLNWMPATVFVIDATARGRRFAWLAVVAVVASQFLRGSGEILMHGLLASGLFAAARLTTVARDEGALVALRRGLTIAAGVTAGLLLAAVQVVPTLELVGSSARAAGKMSPEGARAGALALDSLFDGAISAGAWSSVVTVGLLPLLSVFLASAGGRGRLPWLCALVIVVLAVSLITGGPLFDLYHSLPVVGSMFRRPSKFLDIYTLAMAVLLGLAIRQLEDWSTSSRREVWRHPAWLATLGAGSALVAWWPWSSGFAGYVLATLVCLLIAFGAVSSRRLRLGLVAALCAVQATSLFSSVSNTDMRPWHRPHFWDVLAPAFEPLRQLPSHARAYLFGDQGVPLGWNLKQGMNLGFNVVADYDALVPGRYGGFFDRVSPRPRLPGQNFIGLYALHPASDWRLMDLTGTSYFLAARGKPTDRLLASGQARGGLGDLRLLSDGPVRVYTRDGPLARAYFVNQARPASGEEESLRLLTRAWFQPGREIVVEDAPTWVLAEVEFARRSLRPAREKAGSAEITRYEPEDVSVTVKARTAGFLVLTDLFFPGWKASSEGRELPIYRANSLFRAVFLPAGTHSVEFSYRPASFRLGLALTTAMACLISLAVLISHWRRSVQRRRALGTSR